MATALENLNTAYTTLAAKIATLEAQRAIDLSLDGESYALNGELNGCYERLEKLRSLIQQAGGPVLIRSRGRVV